MTFRALVVDDSSGYRVGLRAALEDATEVVEAGSIQEARRKLSPSFDVILLDVRLDPNDHGKEDGLTLLQEIVAAHPDIPVVMMTAFGDIEMAVGALKAGAADFIQKTNADAAEIRKVVAGVLERARLKNRVSVLENDLRRLQPWEMVGGSSAIEDVRSLVDSVSSDGRSTVLIQGETGTGKELVARAIHGRGWRRDAPFVPVSLPALPKDLIEAELFGHVKGAFTGAIQNRTGLFEAAQGGVLFLDEIGELPLDLQPKLLRVLEERVVTKVGSNDGRRIDVQLVCATNQDLRQLVSSGGFRADLYYRLRTFEIVVPPLRDRIDDLPSLVDHFMFTFRTQGRTQIAGVATESLTLLSRYSFPGNVRELRAIVERGMIVAQNRGHQLIEPSDLPADIDEGEGTHDVSPWDVDPSTSSIDLDAALARAELTYVRWALEQSTGRKADAWRLLQLNDRFALRRRVQRIFERFPEMSTKFPTLVDAFRTRSSRESE